MYKRTVNHSHTHIHSSFTYNSISHIHIYVYMHINNYAIYKKHADIKAAHAARKSMDGTSSGKMLSDASAGSSVGGGSEGLRRRTDDKIKTGKEGGKGEVMNRDIDADGDKSKDKKKSSWFSFFSSSSSSSAEESSSLLVNGEANDMELEGI